MEPGHIFRQDLGRSNRTPLVQGPSNQFRQQFENDLSDKDESGHRIAHTLTACCRCRQRKTRCDANLPRCRPCERSGSVCEYMDTARGKKMNRSYVIGLQDKVRDLEARLAQYTDEEHDYPRTSEDIVRPGGMIRLKASDETSRYLGPSSGVAMTRLLMEEAKRYTITNRISDLLPSRSQTRMQSIQMTGMTPNSGTKSYPAISEQPADGLPSRATMNKLSELFIQQSQTFWPMLHEGNFLKDIDDVFDGNPDPYKNFVVHMVIAISLQKLDSSQYAGLADSYYLAAMRHAESVIRPKDLKTLQCLVLMGHYSLLTPARTPVYHVISLASRICQQEGLTDEQTIATGCTDPQIEDLRRRLVWIVASMDFGLAWHMGRPSGLANGTDRLNVAFFTDVEDGNITPNGITSGTTSDRKLVSIHFFKSRELQAEIKRTLYEQKRPTPTNDSDPWYTSIEQRMKAWLDSAPQRPQWSPLWFGHLYHHTRMVLYRPSPQVPKPSARAANICFESSQAVIDLTAKRIEGSWFSVTWVLSLEVTSSLNALLWSTSYAEVRQAHPRQEVEELIKTAISSLEKCVERLRAPPYISQLYSIISKACLQSYEMGSDQRPTFGIASLSPVAETHSPPETFSQPGGGGVQSHLPYLNPPQFGVVFDSSPESMNAYTFDPNYPPPQPTFRSNSIFRSPATDTSGRRFSYFPPEGGPEDLGQPAPMPGPPGSYQATTSTLDGHSKHVSAQSGGSAMPVMQDSFSPPHLPLQGANLSLASSAPRIVPMGDHTSSLQMQALGRAPPNFNAPSRSVEQRQLPADVSTANWFSPPTSLFSPYTFGPMSSSFFGDAMPQGFSESPQQSGGVQQPSTGLFAHNQFGFPPGRQGSLTQSQQTELMNFLETEGVGDIDAFLNASQNMPDVQWY